MFGFGEMAFLFVLALLVFGPKKLPEIARQIGKAMNEFKKASNEFRSQIESEIANLELETRPQILPPADPGARPTCWISRFRDLTRQLELAGHRHHACRYRG